MKYDEYYCNTKLVQYHNVYRIGTECGTEIYVCNRLIDWSGAFDILYRLAVFHLLVPSKRCSRQTHCCSNSQGLQGTRVPGYAVIIITIAVCTAVVLPTRTRALATGKHDATGASGLGRRCVAGRAHRAHRDHHHQHALLLLLLASAAAQAPPPPPPSSCPPPHPGPPPPPISSLPPTFTSLPRVVFRCSLQATICSSTIPGGPMHCLQKSAACWSGTCDPKQ